MTPALYAPLVEPPARAMPNWNIRSLVILEVRQGEGKMNGREEMDRRRGLIAMKIGDIIWMRWQ